MSDGRIFDAATDSLQPGITLVEASAGTGKTFAIAMLVLRALVEQGVRIEQVLVVTFTIAATEELRERIRSRLRQGRDLLRRLAAGDTVSEEADEVLIHWAAAVTEPAHAAELLDLALLDIDRAAIHTIHGFCQRMLSEQPLESGHRFDLTLTGDIALNRDRLVQDYWRLRLYPLDESCCGLITARYPSPESLYQSIAGADDALAELVPAAVPVAGCCAALESARGVLQQWWREQSAPLQRCLEAAAAGGYLKQDLASSYDSRCDELTEHLARGGAPDAAALAWLQQDVLMEMLNGHKLRGREKKEAFIADWPLPGARLDAYLAAAQSLVLAVRLELAHTLRERLPERLRYQGLLSFDDLVTGLEAAVSGVNGRALRRRIGERYRIALIDEFQDTDQAQWSAFSTLFGTGRHFLYLIGDPKQAIYRFRGADIFSYFAARDRADHRLTLSRNHRSHPGLMGAVNRLFDGHEIAGIPYRPVEPARSREDGRLMEDGAEREALIYCQLGAQPGAAERWSGSGAHERIRAWITAEIAALLSRDSSVRYRARTSAGPDIERPLRPADVAILVRTNQQAETYCESLVRCGISAVISSKTPVFQTEECGQLLTVLQAVAAPGDDRRLRTAMSGDWFGLGGAEHYRICSSEQEFNRWHDRFFDYYQLWLAAGFLPMMKRLLVQEEVYLHLCSAPRAERRIANIDHLVELVQETEQQNRYTIPQLLLWLQKMQGGLIGMEEMELRLESDSEAVTILTMHSAKGLEFPVVFCPVLISASAPGRAGRALTRCHDRRGVLVCDLGSDEFEENRLRSREEELQEDLRLAYVAVTRAKLRCYLFWADIRERGQDPGSFGSPLGQLLFPGGPVDFDTQQQHLRSRGAAADSGYRFIDAETPPVCRYQPPAVAATGLQARRRGTRPLRTNRTLTSFSGLALLSSHEEEEGLAGAYDESSAADHLFLEISRLPGGVRFGNIVHDALERFDFARLATDAAPVQEPLGALCRSYGLAIDLAVLTRLLKNGVTTPLPPHRGSGDTFALAAVPAERLVKEMDFSLRLAASSTNRINEILAADPACAPLAPRDLAGYLTGYIDLICEHDGRYYVIDYKTNNLGDDPGDYSEEAMRRAMRLHNYGLQYWLYTLVVHRFLSRWLEGYRYATHFGGVRYLFVRGMVPERPGSGIYAVLPDEERLRRLDRCLGSETP